MERQTDSTDAQAVLDNAHAKKARKADALAYLSGALQYHVDEGDDVSPETLKRVFNDVLDDAGVEGLEIK